MDTTDLNYDKLSRLTECTDFFGNYYNYGYDSYGRMETIKYPNGLLTVYGYDEAGRLESITHKRETGEVIRFFVYEYDLNRNITKITNEDGSLTDYVYDDWNRLTGETWKNALGMTTLDIQYTFDNAAGDTGNIHQKITTRNGGTPETTTFTYDEYNKLTTINHPGSIIETLTYNANGQLTRSSKSNGEATSYYWNDQGFLTKVLLPSGEPVEYKYDGVGRLTGRKDADGEQIFVQSGWNIMTEQDTEGRRTYYTGSSNQTNNGGEANFFLFNHRGDTVLITDQTGTITNNLHYEAYGKTTDSNGNPTNPALSSSLTPLFVGAYGIRYDRKTELSYMRFRWYDNDKMRFVEPDIYLSLNSYLYAENNPCKYIDPFGDFVAVAAGGVVASGAILGIVIATVMLYNNTSPEIKQQIADAITVSYNNAAQGINTTYQNIRSNINLSLTNIELSITDRIIGNITNIILNEAPSWTGLPRHPSRKQVDNFEKAIKTKGGVPNSPFPEDPKDWTKEIRKQIDRLIKTLRKYASGKSKENWKGSGHRGLLFRNFDLEGDPCD